MIRRPSTRSVWLALAFIDTSMVAMVSPQRKSVSPSATAFGASPGPMKLRRNPAPPTMAVVRSPSRRMIRPTMRNPSIVPAGIPNRQNASVSTSSPSASFTSGMRGNQTERPTAFNANTICSGKSRPRSEDMSGNRTRRLRRGYRGWSPTSSYLVGASALSSTRTSAAWLRTPVRSNIRCRCVRSVFTLTPRMSEAAARSWPSTISRASRTCAGDRP